MNTDERDHLINLRTEHVKRFRVLELKMAQLGTEVPPSIIIELSDTEKRIADIDRKLSQLKPVSIYPSGEEKSVVEVVIKGDADKLTTEKARTIKGVLAALMDIPAEQITVLAIVNGSIVLILRAPREAVRHLLVLFQSGDINLQQLGVERVRTLYVRASLEQDILSIERSLFDVKLKHSRYRLSNGLIYLLMLVSLGLCIYSLLNTSDIPFPWIVPLLIAAFFLYLFVTIVNKEILQFEIYSLTYRKLSPLYTELWQDIARYQGYDATKNLRPARAVVRSDL